MMTMPIIMTMDDDARIAGARTHRRSDTRDRIGLQGAGRASALGRRNAGDRSVVDATRAERRARGLEARSSAGLLSLAGRRATSCAGHRAADTRCSGVWMAMLPIHLHNAFAVQ